MSPFFSFTHQKYFGFYFTLLLHGALFFVLCININPKISAQQIIKINFLNTKSAISNNNFSSNFNQNSKTNTTNKHKSSSTNQAQIDPIYQAVELNNPSPIYPPLARAQGIAGKVTLEVLVSETGKALNVKIFSSSGSDILDESALETVANWNFVPAQKFGVNVQAKIFVPIEFKLI